MEKQSSLILVEGKSEVNVLPELCRLCGIDTTNFEIKKENSLSELKKALKTHLKSTNTLRKLWVIIDADVNFDAAWQSIKDILLRSGKYSFDMHTPLPEDGFVVKPDDKADLTIGVWIMPNNKDVGMLEDFMMKLIPETDALLPIADSIVEEIDSKRHAHSGIFKVVHKSKAKIHTWLSWHDAPGESLSVAVQKRLFATDKVLCSNFIKWLNTINQPD